MSIHIENDEQYDEILKEQTLTGKAIFVKCSAPWCGPCRVIAPYYDQLATENKDNVFISLNVEDCESTAISLKISGLPTFVVLKDGKEVSRVVGANKKKLNAVTESYAEQQ